MSSRLRKAYVAAKLLGVSDLIARARQSEATAACSSVVTWAKLVHKMNNG
jgi:hypothetical protein